MILHGTNKATLMTNSVGESRHVGHTFQINLLSCSKFTYGSNTRTHADIRQTFRILRIQIDIYIYIYIYIFHK